MVVIQGSLLDIDGRPYTAQDARATVRCLGGWWEMLAADRRLPPGFDGLVAEQVGLLAHVLGEPPPAPSLDELARLSAAADRAIGAGTVDVALLLVPSLSLLATGSELLRAAGSLPATSTGTVAQVNLSQGGVPKRAVETATIDLGGVVGDRQHSRQHHGRPWQALCLWSADVVDALAADGHPIGYGSCGENLSLRGLAWPEVRSGVRLAIGPVLAEVSTYALPCKKNAQWFSDGDFNRMHHERGPISRVYATVLRGGTVQAGDPVVLEP